MLSGHATVQGTQEFAQKSGADSSNYNEFAGLTLSNVGIGTYLGEPDSNTDTLVKEAVKRSVLAGVNVIDTAINYRAQLAERSVGAALSELTSDEKISRDQIFVSTKNGYVTNDAAVPGDFWKYITAEYVEKNVIKSGDISSGYHCMTVPYLEDQLERSLKNLDLDCIDLLYIHNAVEGQIKDITREELLEKLAAAFELYESKRGEGKIQFYGMATWECFRVPPDNPQYLKLEDVVNIAKKIGGDDHGFRFIQLPFNLYYDQAYMKKTQPVGGEQTSALDAARRLGIGVFTSVPLMQGRLLQPGVMPEFLDQPPAIRAVQFIRSTPGVLAPLVGQKSPAHLDENLAVMKIPPVSSADFSELIKKLVS